MLDNDIRKNADGYYDPTAYKAIKKVSKAEDNDDARFFKLLNAIFTVCDLAGFQIEGRIIVKDKKTGKIWR